LGGCFLYAALVSGGMGLVLSGRPVQFPVFLQWTSAAGEPLLPFLIITVACGACSGFHAIVSSGTSSKQLRRETDARLIGYGAMLLEALVAAVSLGCVMMLTPADPLAKKAPNFIYACGIGQFLGVFGVPAAFGISFGLLAFTTFVYDTLDVCTRLGRYIIQELTGWRSRAGRLGATAIMAAVPLLFVMRTTRDAKGNVIPAWKAFWTLFGASNQLLAALTLLGVTVWLVRTRRAWWVWLVTGLPTAFMYVMSVWALAAIVLMKMAAPGGVADPIPWAAAILIGLAALMLVEAATVLAKPKRPPPDAGSAPAP
jgi:carbon starvation protein